MREFRRIEIQQLVTRAFENYIQRRGGRLRISSRGQESDPGQQLPSDSFRPQLAATVKQF